MANITFIDDDGQEIIATATNGSLMQLAVEAGVSGVKGDCGGNAACATCHVYVPDEWRNKLDDASEAELAMLEFEDSYSDQSRLACQISVTEKLDGLRVTVVPSE